MLKTFINSFVLFFITIDTIGNLPFFLSLTEDAKFKKKTQIAIKSTIIAFFILIAFAYIGRYLLEALGVSLDSLKIAGGVILMFIAIDILFEKRKIRREKKVVEALDEKNYDEIVVFPIAIPFIAGPATLATIILLIGNYANFPEFQVPVILALVVALIVSLILMIGGSYIVKFLPKQFLHTTARVMAFILAALATQFIIDGIKASFNI
jgi:multiple antibiotic resistance protein|tara:strand:- start:144 stop:770 length:627 start_codon:yes stop_codon:yes gene_type:complete